MPKKFKKFEEFLMKNLFLIFHQRTSFLSSKILFLYFFHFHHLLLPLLFWIFHFSFHFLLKKKKFSIKFFKDAGKKKKTFYYGCGDDWGLGGKKTATTAQNSGEFRVGLREKSLVNLCCTQTHSQVPSSSIFFCCFLFLALRKWK